MAKVELYRLNNNGKQDIIVVCRLEGGRVICEGDKGLVEHLEGEGIFDYSSTERKKLYPRDGLNFLEQLKFNFKSGYLNASDVIKD